MGYWDMGIFMAILIIVLWLGHLTWALTNVDVSLTNAWMYLHIFIQAHLTTGLFITSHDSIHGTISKNRKVNYILGWITSVMYAFFPYDILRKNHYEHHMHVGTAKDPDFNVKTQNVFRWWFGFLWHYGNIWQLVGFGTSLAVLSIWLPAINIIILWFFPAFLSSFQLFYFGTYLPHKLPHHNLDPTHKSRSQKKNHIWALLSCYFFGYHLEHHKYPNVPWWKLYQKKN
jgi:beta-carotene/zeaxanthin 4-ketolase